MARSPRSRRAFLSLAIINPGERGDIGKMREIGLAQRGEATGYTPAVELAFLIQIAREAVHP